MIGDEERELMGSENDASLFAEAMSDEPVSEAPQPEPEAEIQPKSQPRDDLGRFAENSIEKEIEVEEPVHLEPQSSQKEKPSIPPYRLKEEADARRDLEERYKAAEERAARFESVIMELVARQSQPPKQPEAPAPDVWENPDNWFEHRAKSVFSSEFQQLQAAHNAMSRQLAEIKFGDDRVKEAEQAFNELTQRNAMDPMEYQRIINAPNRFAAAVEWHNRTKVLSEVGNDPEAYKAKLLEAALADPAFRARVIEAERGSQQPQKTGNITRLPPSLVKTSGNSSNSNPRNDGPSSDKEMLRWALKS